MTARFETVLQIDIVKFTDQKLIGLHAVFPVSKLSM